MESCLCRQFNKYGNGQINHENVNPNAVWRIHLRFFVEKKDVNNIYNNNSSEANQREDAKSG